MNHILSAFLSFQGRERCTYIQSNDKKKEGNITVDNTTIREWIVETSWKGKKPETQNFAEISYIPTSTNGKYSQKNHPGYIFGS